MPGDDLPALRAQTKQFINVNPKVVNLQRQTTASDGSGGITRTLSSVGNQTFRLIEQPHPQSQVFRRTVDGQEVVPEYVLLGEYTANVQNGDYWMDGGIKFEVVYVKLDRRYESWSEVAYRG